MKPLDQVCSTGANAPVRTSKLVNKSEFNGSILEQIDGFRPFSPRFPQVRQGQYTVIGWPTSSY